MEIHRLYSNCGDEDGFILQELDSGILQRIIKFFDISTEEYHENIQIVCVMIMFRMGHLSIGSLRKFPIN